MPIDYEYTEPKCLPNLKPNNYNCRHSNGSLKIVPAGRTREREFCPDCERRPYRGKACLFPKATPIVKKFHPLTTNNRSRKIQPQAAVEVMKELWLKLGRPPQCKDLDQAQTTPSANWISKHYPGGIPAARQEAQEQLAKALDAVPGESGSTWD